MLTVKIIVFFAALVIAVVLGEKRKINAGITAIAFAFIIGILFSSLGVSGVIGLFPTRVFYNLFIATLFYGFANENGTMAILTKKLVYAFRKAQWSMPLVLFLIAFILSASGAAMEASVILLSPIGFSLALAMNFNPFLVAVGIWAGGCMGNWVPWASFYNMFASQCFDVMGQDLAYSAFNHSCVSLIIILTAIVLAFFFIYKGYKAKGEVDVANAEFTPVQKKTFWIMVVSLIVIVIPALIQLIVPNAVTKWMTANLGIQTVAAISAAVMAILGVADNGTVLRNRVPWSLLMMVCGVSMLMGLCTPLGITDAVSSFLANGGIPIWLVVPALTALLALLSFFVSGAVLQPLVVALSTPLMSLGISGITVIVAAQAGGVVSSLSPYSAAGAMAISGCPEELRLEVSSKMMRYAIILSVVVTLIAFTGAYAIGT